MDSFRRWEMKDIDLIKLGSFYVWIVDKRTVSELRVLGTAINSSSSEFCNDAWANEQKFMVFTWSICNSHGNLRGSVGVSTGRTLLIEASSSSDSFHTTSLLSLPCLQKC